jgi:hypothetical protein
MKNSQADSFRCRLARLKLQADLENEIVAVFSEHIASISGNGTTIRYTGKRPWNDTYLEHTGMWEVGQSKIVPKEVAKRLLANHRDVFEPSGDENATLLFSIAAPEEAGLDPELEKFNVAVDAAGSVEALMDLAAARIPGWKIPKKAPKDLGGMALLVKNEAGRLGVN